MQQDNFGCIIMRYIDVHAHLDMQKFDDDRDSVVENAKSKGILIVSSGVNPVANRKVLEYSKKYDNVLAAFGIYPIDAIKKDFPEVYDDGPRGDIEPFEIDEEIEWIKEHKEDCVLIGEIGLDFKVIIPTEEMKKAQIENFRKIIKLSKEIDKPILIHSRGAERECIEILEEYNCKKVIMHCFNGKKSLIRRIVENGWYLTVPAVITRLEHFKMLTELVPLEQILTETDAPYLSPVLGMRNDSTSVLTTIKEISKIKNVLEEKVQEQIMDNAKNILNINFNYSKQNNQ